MKILRFIDEEGRVNLGCDYKGNEAKVIKGNLFDEFETTDETKIVKKILTPFIPSNILCIGLNYYEHAKEIKMPIPKYPALFMKSLTSIQNPFDPIIIPKSCQNPDEVDYEIELAVVIGKECKNITKDEAKNYILGYTIANDVSARRWQKNAGGMQWVRSKSFDTFCPFGPYIATKDEVSNPQDLNLVCYLNGNIMQNANTSDMIFSVYEIVSYLSEGMTLLPGTLILTGTPKGVGYARKEPVYLKDKDILELKIDKLGVLVNEVKSERDLCT